jgi:hypothetical protein
MTCDFPRSCEISQAVDALIDDRPLARVTERIVVYVKIRVNNSKPKTNRKEKGVGNNGDW